MQVKVISNASKNDVVGFEGEVLKIKCTALPEKGKANESVIALLAAYYNVPKNTITILRGTSSSHKTIEIKNKNLPVVSITATIFFEKRFWVGCFERTDKKGYSVARKVFGAEPTDAEIYDFVLRNYHELQFGDPQKFKLKIKRKNPKRVQREIRREMEQAKALRMPSTLAQDYMRDELERHKKEKKKNTTAEKKKHMDEQFSLKQNKKKAKKKGH